MNPQRTCLGCRRSDDQDRLLRLVRVGDEVVDATRPRLPGRGAYLHLERTCVEGALKRGALRRAFRAAVEPDAALAEQLAGMAPGWIQGPSGE